MCAFLDVLKYGMRLRESRKNPSQNVKQVGHNAAMAYLKTLPTLDNIGISMTDLPKLGINPGSTYNTPIGIYFYPASYYVEKLLKNQSLPFQHEANYINVFQYDSEHKLNLDDLNHDKPMLSLISDKLGEMMDTNMTPAPDAKTAWDQMMRTSMALERDGKYPIKWNKIIRRLGFTVILDPGFGIIHPAELAQGVILDPRVIISNKRFSQFPSQVENKFGKRVAHTLIPPNAMTTVLTTPEKSPGYMTVFSQHVNRLHSSVDAASEWNEANGKIAMAILVKSIKHALFMMPTNVGIMVKEKFTHWSQFKNYPYPSIHSADEDEDNILVDYDAYHDWVSGMNQMIKQAQHKLLQTYTQKLKDKDVPQYEIDWIIGNMKTNMGIYGK